jgi:outer membrane protein TolC
MKRKFMIIALLMFQAAAAQNNPIPVSLAECIAKALGQNPSMKISEAAAENAEAHARETGAALLPQLRLAAGAMELSSVPAYTLTLPLPPPFNFSKTIFPDITENYSLKLSMQQPVFTGFKLSKSKEMSDLNAEAAREDYSKERFDMVVAVTVAYWTLYSAVESERVIGQTVEQVNEHLKDIQSSAQQGMATDADVMKVQVQLSSMKVKHVQARNNIRIASMTLNSLIGNSLSDNIFAVDDPQEIDAAVDGMMKSDVSILTDRAVEKRPEIKSMKLRTEMSDAGVAAAKGGWYPQVYLGADYNFARPNPRILPPADEWNGTWDVGITVQWTIWDWFTTRHQTAQAEASLKQSEAGLSKVYDAVKLEVTREYYAAQTASEEIAVADSGAEQAQESYRMTREKFKMGMASNSDLLDAETALLQAKLTFMQARVDYKVAAAKLKRAVGGLQ